MTSLAVAALMPAFCARAQYKPTGEDGITASPKVRQMLNDRPTLQRSAGGTAANKNLLYSAGDGIAASPKVRAHLDERNAIAAAASLPSTVTASTTRPPNDGIAASPKLREQMRERVGQTQVEIAPIKTAK